MNKTILIVEDEVILSDALYDRLTREGFKVLREKDGQEGLTRALEYHPDLTLLDILMPKMNGMEVLKKIREDNWGKTAKVILFTNLTDVDNISDALNDQVTDYLIKSEWDIDDLVKKIKEKL